MAVSEVVLPLLDQDLAVVWEEEQAAVVRVEVQGVVLASRQGCWLVCWHLLILFGVVTLVVLLFFM